VGTGQGLRHPPLLPALGQPDPRNRLKPPFPVEPLRSINPPRNRPLLDWRRQWITRPGHGSGC
jgi:hypothetical protein